MHKFRFLNLILISHILNTNVSYYLHHLEKSSLYISVLCFMNLISLTDLLVNHILSEVFPPSLTGYKLWG